MPGHLTGRKKENSLQEQVQWNGHKENKRGRESSEKGQLWDKPTGISYARSIINFLFIATEYNNNIVSEMKLNGIL